MNNSDPSAKVMFGIKGLGAAYFLGSGLWYLVTMPFSWAFIVMIVLGVAFAALMWRDPLRDELLFAKKPQVDNDTTDDAPGTPGNDGAHGQGVCAAGESRS